MHISPCWLDSISVIVFHHGEQNQVDAVLAVCFPLIWTSWRSWLIFFLSQQISDLKKENFNLKLRIYFLEMQMQQKFDGPTEDMYKIVCA